MLSRNEGFLLSIFGIAALIALLLYDIKKKRKAG